MTELKKMARVADILEREVQPTIKEWLRRVKLVPELIHLSLSQMERTGHLHKPFRDLVLRLRTNAHPFGSADATAHGELRYSQGYSAAMLVDKSRLLQVATFSTLGLYQRELDQNHVFPDIVVIADEANLRLTEHVRS
jgi:hypothetical protein